MTGYRKRTRAEMFKDDDLVIVNKLASPETFASVKTTPTSCDGRWGPFHPHGNLTSQLVSKKDPSSCANQVPHLEPHTFLKTRSAQHSSIQKLQSTQSFPTNAANASKTVNAFKFQANTASHVNSKVEQIQVLQAKNSSPILKSTTSEPSLKQKKSRVQQTPILDEIPSNTSVSNASKNVNGLKLQENASTNLDSMVKESQVQRVAQSSPIWKSVTSDPSSKQKPLLARDTPVPEIQPRGALGSIRRPPRITSTSNTSGCPSFKSTKSTLRPSGSTELPSESAYLSSSSTKTCTQTTTLQSSDPTASSTLRASKECHKNKILNSTMVNKKSDTLFKSVNVLANEGKMPPSAPGIRTGLATGEVCSNVSQPFRPRRLGLMPDWPDDVQFDEKEEVLTIDMEGNYKSVGTAIQPHDVWHSNGVKFFVTFNEFYQPLRRGGHILIKFIGDVAKTESLCPIRETNWRRVNEQYKVDIIKTIREHFVIPDGDSYDQAILKRTGKSLRQYRHHLKVSLFKPATKTKAQLYDSGPVGHPRASWIYLVDYWSSNKGKELAECGKEARSSQNHTHITGSTSYANIRADFEDEKNREPSHFEIFGITHRRKDGTFVKETFTEELLEEVDAAVQTEIDINPSIAKSRVKLENETFNKIMYGDEVPERPVGFGFGVNKSDISGVRGLLREGRINGAKNDTLAFQNMEKDMADLKEENKVLKAQHNEDMADLKEENKVLKAQHNENTQLLKSMTTQFSQIIEIFSTGKATPEFLNIAKTMLDATKSQVPKFTSDQDNLRDKDPSTFGLQR